MALPFTFAGVTNPVTSQLDANFAALGALTAIPCGVSGSNALVLTPAVNTPTVTAYANYQTFSGVAVLANTGAVTVTVGSLATLAVYLDTSIGPVALSGGEIVAGSAVMVTYDSALGGGTGGFHLASSAQLPPVGAVPATVNSGVGVTLTAAQLTGSGSARAILLRTGAPGAGFNDTTATATAIATALPGVRVGTYFQFTEVNSTGQTQTLLGGTGVTIVGVATTATGVTHQFTGVVTAVGGTPTVTIVG